jgi:branched-chain amino acid transport system ATP-binding protein
LSGLLRPTSGDIYFQGERLSGRDPHEITQRGIVQIPEGRRIFPLLSVYENLMMGAFFRKDHAAVAQDKEKVFEMFPILKERGRQLGGTLSGGEQQMLAFGRALMSRPKLLALDEPSMGLAPIIVDKVFQIIREINKEGVTILLVEQNARGALAVAERGYVMETGGITIEDSAANLLKNDRVKQCYLGIEESFI